MANHPSVTAFVEMTNAMNRYSVDMDIILEHLDVLPAREIPILVAQVSCHRAALVDQLCDFQEALLLGGEPRSVIEASITCVNDLLGKIDAVLTKCTGQ